VLRRAWIILILLILSLCLSVEVQVVYVAGNMDLGVVKRFEVPDGVDPAVYLFDMLASPPTGYRSFVPAGVLRAVYLLSDTIVVDLEGKKARGMDFYSERMFIYQLLLSLFRTFDVKTVHILVDGKAQKALAKYVDISLGFRRQDWLNWPLEVETH